MTHRQKILLVASIALVLLVVAGRSALRAHQNLVTLDVRNMEVRDVVKKIGRQTWEDIRVASDVQGKITLNVKNAPLDAVLDLVAGQSSSRSRHYFPIYKSSRSLKNLNAILDRPASNIVSSTTWTNLSLAGGPRGGGMGGFGGMGFESTNHSLITLKVVAREVPIVARTISYAGRIQVVPEDGLPARVSINLDQATAEEAVKKMAQALKAKTDDFYVLQKGFIGRPPASDGERRQSRPEFAQNLTAEQKAKMAEMRNMSPEDRRAKMQERMEDPAVQQQMSERMLAGIRNSTPEQMIQQKRERRQRGGQFGQPGQDQSPRRAQ
jgi:hypothetical protein